MSDHSQPAIINGEFTDLGSTPESASESALAPRPEPPPPFKWSATRKRAAALIAGHDLTVQQIADKLGLNRQSLWLYQKNPVFAERVRELEQEADARMLNAVVARKQKRVELIESLLLDALTLRQERGEKMASSKIDKDVPGVSTGMVARLEKVIGAGQAARLVREYRWDTDLEVAIERLLKAGKEEFSGVEHDSDSGIKRLYVGINIDAV